MEISKRNITVDIAKIIAAFGVIAIHVPSDNPSAGYINTFFWPLCVPFFYVISLTYFVAALNKNITLSAVLTKTWYRIILPYLAWTAVYVFLLAVKSHLAGAHHSFTWWRIIFYGQSAVQLYYLPELVILQAFALSIYLLWSGDGKKKLIGLVILLFATGYIVWGHVYNAFGILPVPSIFVYIIISFLISSKIRNLTLNYKYLLIGIFLVAIVVGANFLKMQCHFLSDFTQLPIGGIGMMLLTFGLPKYKMQAWAMVLCSTSYGIYLGHVLFLEGFELTIKKTAPCRNPV